MRRHFVSGFVTLTDFTTARASAVNSQAVLSPEFLLPASITLNGTIPFSTGSLYVGLSVDEIMAGVTCDLVVASTSMATTSFPIPGAGAHAIAIAGVQPEDDITTLKITCSGLSPSTATFDWITVQNGPYAWAPFVDVAMSFSTMVYPGTGRQSVVRAGEGYDGTGGILLVGSDVGGLAFAEAHDPESADTIWRTINGRAGDWVDAGDLGVFEAFGRWRSDANFNASPDVEEYDVYALTGEGTMDQGGLWVTSNLNAANQQWTEVDSTLGAFKHYDDCPGHTGKELESGRLILGYPNYPWLLVASQRNGNRGVFFYEEGTTGAFDIYNGLPDATLNALPSALATNEVDQEAPGEALDWLLVGYRPIVSNEPGFDPNALYFCPAGFDPGSLTPSSSCVPVVDTIDGDWIGDVRDIEPDPSTIGRFFVADGGRLYDSTAGECSFGEPTVWVVDAYIGLGGPEFDVWDTDSLTSGPSWNTGAMNDYYANTCLNGGATDSAFGNLVPPSATTGAEAHEISSITVDPLGDWLFAFYPLGDNSREYGCPAAFRASLSGLTSGSTLGWRPFQDFEHGNTNMAHGTSPHARARRDNVENIGGARGAFMDDEPLKEDWVLRNTHDAVFVPLAGGGAHLLTGGSFLWWAFRDADVRGVDVGWDTPNTPVVTDTTCAVAEDLDCADVALALGDPLTASSDGGMALQDSTGKALAVCPGCGIVGNSPYDVLIGAGLADYKMAKLYGGSPTSRQAADRPCEMHMVGAAGKDVDVWVDPTGVVEPQAWMIFHPQTSFTEVTPGSGSYVADASMTRGIMFSEQVASAGEELGDEWWWDAAQNSSGYTGLAPLNYLQSSAYGWGLTCQDSNFDTATGGHLWPPLDPAAPFNMNAIGMPEDILALGDAAALLLTAPACSTQNCATSDAATRGVWHVENTGSGLVYTEVEFNPPTGDTCTEAEVIRYEQIGNTTYNSTSRLALAPDSDLGGTIHFYVTSRYCGIYDVTYTHGDEANAQWTKLSLATPCDLTTAYLEGVTPTHDGTGLLAWGSDSGGLRGGVCLVDFGSGATRNVVPAAQAKGSIWTLIAHPHIEDTYYFGLFRGQLACTTCSIPGVYMLQRRDEPATGLDTWGSKRLSSDDLEHRTVVDLDWGPGTNAATAPVSHLYVTTAGGGFWDGSVTWP